MVEARQGGHHGDAPVCGLNISEPVAGIRTTEESSVGSGGITHPEAVSASGV
jgi:hypothetical protein